MDVVGDFVGCCLGVGDLEVDHGVDTDDQVILGDDGLGGEGYDLFTQVNEGQDAVDKGNGDVDAGFYFYRCIVCSVCFVFILGSF